ncbi:MAG TPA: heme-copper oxidase subunit III [Bacteroidia bacterium]|jgi:heme/copper-type cytochrome/quinol oxidase subunit 3|nr:heme-copper oxidase subunit III [Bacteroidia bacterium]
METAIRIPIKEKKLVSDGVIGMLFVLATEAMFFSGLISAFVINRAGSMAWPPADQPRLPVEVTAVNTIVLLASAVTIFLFGRKIRRIDVIDKKSTGLLITTILLGATFLAVQGTEWVRLIGFGLTAHSSLYGAFFYTIIGIHGAHVIAGLIVLFYLLSALIKPASFEASKNRIAVCSMYWYFVVAVWPVLYILVYLS